MADVGPAPGLIQLKVRLEIATQQQKVAQYMHDLMQQKVQKDRTMTNLKASTKALDDCQSRLANLIEEHGEIVLDLSDYIA